MARRTSPLILAAACSTLIAVPVQAQTIRLTTPNATLKEEFSSIRGVRELPDGRVLVSDYLDQRVVVADFDRGMVTTRVTKGSGPQEARLPTRLVPAWGDSTFLVDLGNNRLLVLDGQGRPARTIQAERFGLLGVRGVDPKGGLYYAIPGWVERDRALPNDSVRVVRWNPRAQVEEQIAVIQGDRMRSDIREPARTPRIPLVGYSSQDAWLVTDGGTIRIVRTGGYRVESMTAGSPARVGPSYAYPTRPVTNADRVAFVRQFLITSPTSGKGENGGMGFSPPPTEQEIARLVPGTQFAERHPMFDPGEVRSAPDGRVWVGRPAEQGKPVLYDIFDQNGRLVAAVELRPGRRVGAVGRHGAYLVMETDQGLQYLERYSLPR